MTDDQETQDEETVEVTAEAETTEVDSDELGEEDIPVEQQIQNEMYDALAQATREIMNQEEFEDVPPILFFDAGQDFFDQQRCEYFAVGGDVHGHEAVLGYSVEEQAPTPKDD